MSSNIRIQRISQQCGQEFTARTTVTQYCGDNCAKRAYKARKKAGKVEASNRETERLRNRPLEDIKAKEFLTIRDTALLINCSRQTVYNLIKANVLPALQLTPRKTIVKRADIDNLFQLTPSARTEEPLASPPFDPAACYTLTQVQQHYGISEKALYELIKRHNIPKYRQGIYAFVLKKPIDELLGYHM